MKRIITIAITLVVSAELGWAAETTTKQLEWKKHYGTSRRVAQATKRPMLLVLEDPAKKRKLDESKITTKDRSILTKDKFELCRVDVTTEYGKRVAKAFGAKVFPYTVVTDDTSKRIVFRKPGQMTHKDWTLALAPDNRARFAKPAVSVYRPSLSFPGGTLIQPPTATQQTNCFT